MLITYECSRCHFLVRHLILAVPVIEPTHSETDFLLPGLIARFYNLIVLVRMQLVSNLNLNGTLVLCGRYFLNKLIIHMKIR